MALTDNLVSYYKFDGDANDSVGTNDGTVYNAILTSSGKINQAYNYNYDSSTIKYIEYNSTELNQNTFNSDYSISFWVNPDLFPGSDWLTILNKPYTSHTPPYYQFLFNIGSDGFTCILSDSSDDSIFSLSYTTSTLKWYHIILTYNDTSKEFKFYVDGTLRDSATVGDHTNYNTKLTTGILTNLTSTSNYQMKGIIDEMGFWSRALTSSEVSQHYNSGDGLQYPFTTDEGNNNFYTLSLAAEF
jgi:hypothetical protein